MKKSVTTGSRAVNGAVRERILDMLEQSGGWCSGEDLSGRLGVTRAAVAKHMAALRSGGHAIAAATRRGYKLLARRDKLDGPFVAEALATRFMGKKGWLVLEETASTNLEALRLASEGAEDGFVVAAERQTRGRGRKGHDWISVPRGLQFSVILRPEPSRWDAELLTSLGAVAVARALRQVAGLPATYKAPNDVLVGGRKIAGVLVETGLRGSEPEWAVVGIGCNVNSLPEDFPEEGRESFTSTLAETGRVLPRPALLAAILESLEGFYLQLREAGLRREDIPELADG